MSYRTATWLAWSMCAVCVALIALALFPHFLDFVTPEPIVLPLAGRPSSGFAVLTGVLSLAYPMVGALIASRLPSNPIGWIFCSVGLLYSAQRLSLAYADYAVVENLALPARAYAAWFSTLVDFTGLVLAGVFVMLLFPDGRLLSRRWQLVGWMVVLGAVLTALYDAFYPGRVNPYTYFDNPFEFFWTSTLVGEVLLLTSSLAALFSLFVRLHRARGDERQQLKWFLYATVPAGLCFSFVLLSYSVFDFTYLVFGTPLEPFGQNEQEISYVGVFALLFVPVFTYIAILKYRLYYIDVVINRTLVYGALTACVAGIYVLAVVALGALFQAQGHLAVSLSATGLVAVLFQPLRSRLQRGVNRLMYGERDDPYAVTSRLGRRLEATLVPEAVLPTVVETIAQALKLPYAAILLQDGNGYRTAASYGSPRGESETLPLIYQREEIGQLVLSPRAPGEGFSDADRDLLEDLARQAEVAVHAVRLTADLQSSRERLVATREEERRRLRRDLHDGLGAQLAGLNVQAGALRRLI